jgi:hypothetical protein
MNEELSELILITTCFIIITPSPNYDEEAVVIHTDPWSM